MLSDAPKSRPVTGPDMKRCYDLDDTTIFKFLEPIYFKVCVLVQKAGPISVFWPAVTTAKTANHQWRRDLYNLTGYGDKTNITDRFSGDP